jgi:regulation of enolase protein 1 (concanavalin A-like superfamily)
MDGEIFDLFSGCDGTNLNSRLTWLRKPAGFRFGEDGLEIEPVGKTDFFRPYGGEPVDNACLLSTAVTGDFTAVTAASARLAGFGDAAALTVRSDEEHWLKICIERSPVGEIAIVTVVTDRWSDDCNSELLQTADAQLRISRKGDTFGMQYRTGTGPWRFVRTFGFELPKTVQVGIHAQAPFRAGCTAKFRSFTLSDRPVDDLRSGD